MDTLSIYDEYALYGVDKYYQNFSDTYYNPHEEKIKEVLVDICKQYLHVNSSILDFSCGDGLVSKFINDRYKDVLVKGSDPYFNNKYCNYNFSFDDIICGKMTDKFDIVICCYAYHLLEINKRYDFLTQLSLFTRQFIILSPSKKITIVHPLWSIIENKRIDKITIIVLESKYK
jgi:hypothetical protein